jgi:hypothetical protein
MQIKKDELLIRIKNYLTLILFLLFFLGMIGIVDATGHKVTLVGAFFIGSLIAGMHYIFWSDETYKAFEESRGKRGVIDYQTQYQRYNNYQKLAIFELIFVIILFGIPEEFILFDSQLFNTLIITIITYIILMIKIKVDRKSKNNEDKSQL